MEEKIIQELICLEEEGGEALLVTIVETYGSTPRSVGTKMLILPQGRVLGTTGGGFGEEEVIKKGEEILEKSLGPMSLTLQITQEVATEEGMISGGRQVFFLQPLFFEGACK